MDLLLTMAPLAQSFQTCHLVAQLQLHLQERLFQAVPWIGTTRQVVVTYFRKELHLIRPQFYHQRQRITLK